MDKRQAVARRAAEVAGRRTPVHAACEEKCLDVATCCCSPNKAPPGQYIKISATPNTSWVLMPPMALIGFKKLFLVTAQHVMAIKTKGDPAGWLAEARKGGVGLGLGLMAPAPDLLTGC